MSQDIKMRKEFACFLGCEAIYIKLYIIIKFTVIVSLVAAVKARPARIGNKVITHRAGIS